MPAQPSLKKQMISVRLDRELYRKVNKLAKLHGLTMADVLVAMIEDATKNIELSAKDYEEIAKEIRKAQQLRDSAKR